MSKNETQKTVPTVGDLVSYDRWLENIGRTRSTGWRWRKNGVITVTTIFGRHFLTRTVIEDFERRAAAGEFKRRGKGVLK